MNKIKKHTDSAPEIKKQKRVKINKTVDIEISLEIDISHPTAEIKSAEITDINIVKNDRNSLQKNIYVRSKADSIKKDENRTPKKKPKQGIINAIIMALFVLGVMFAIYYTTYSVSE